MAYQIDHKRIAHRIIAAYQADDLSAFFVQPTPFADPHACAAADHESSHEIWALKGAILEAAVHHPRYAALGLTTYREAHYIADRALASLNI